MKLLFLHLSDLHLKKNAIINEKVDRIVDAVRSIKTIDKYVVICSGDLAYSGSFDEYKSVKIFFGKLIEEIRKLRNQFIPLYLVPGNHDIYFPSNARGSSKILEYYEADDVENAYENELKMQDGFFNYAAYKGCFVRNRVLDTRILNCENLNIQINLINTTPFSTLKPDNKELHYLPDKYLYELIKKDSAELAISIMHHSTEWFHHKTKISLEMRLNADTDIVFQGHDHQVSGTQNNNMVIFKGGEFSGEITHKSTFSIVVLNTENLDLTNAIFEWDETNAMFCKVGKEEKCKIRSKSAKLYPKPEFIESLLKDDNNISSNVLDYFVFPKLQHDKRNTHDEGEIISEQELWENIANQKTINICGRDGNGKSTLLKHLYIQCLSRQMLPLFLDRETTSKKAIAKSIKSLFQEQYGEDEFLFNRYEQADIKKKILFVDDLDFIKHQTAREKLISEAQKHVGNIVFSTQVKFEINLSNATKDLLLRENEYYCLKIDDFYKEKRTELIKKVCDVTNPTNNQLVDYVVQVVDRLVSKRNGLFELSPSSIVEYIKFFLKRDIDDCKGEAVYNIVFETNLRNAIISNASENKVDSIMTALEEIAFMMHVKGSESVSLADIVLLIDTYNREYDISISIEDCLRTAQNGKIIKKSNENNHYEFYNRNYLAYFIAKRLNKLIEKNGFNIPELKEIFDNICYGINDNILLFLSFLRDNTAFALNLCGLLDDIVNEYEELNFDSKNIRFIARMKEIEVAPPSLAEKKHIEQLSEEQERQVRNQEEQQQIQYMSIYEYRISAKKTFEDSIICALKYLEVISKSLISHYTTLNREEKEKIITRMYSAPNKILFALFKPWDDNYNELVSEIKQLTDNKHSKEDVEKFITRSAIGICLSIYDKIAFYGVNSETLKLLNVKSYYKSSNHKIANLIMEENGGRTDIFIDKAISLIDDENDSFITNLVQLIARKHILTYDINHAMLDRMTSKIFPQSAHKTLLLISASKANKKDN